MNREGIVFDIQRCSLHDGPGIRTTIFLKGCPLHCIWCHNPESQVFSPQLSFNLEKCTGCGECMKNCPRNAKEKHPSGVSLNHNLCCGCGKCIPECRFNALKIIGEQWTAEQVLTEVMQDVDYYLSSGGGITLSGGEPMSQFAFTKEILKLSKAQGIHTCLETCGFAKKEQYEEILPLVDLFLYDYKMTVDSKHQDFTGVSNTLILSNLEALYHSDSSIVLRCPLIPGINDTEEHLLGIASLYLKYPKLKGIEIMPYHTMGNDKARCIGMSPLLGKKESATEEDKSKWLEALNSLGVVNVKIG